MNIFRILLCFLVFECLGCSLTAWDAVSSESADLPASKLFTGVFVPDPADVPFFQAIAEDQEKRLSSCKTEDECRAVHYLRGVVALYENRELAALHFRKVVVSRPSSILAQESRFWLWLLDMLNAPNGGEVTSEALLKRLTRQVVHKELLIHELSGRVENVSVDALEREVGLRNKTIEELNETVAVLTKQVEQYKKEQSQQEDLRQELKASEKKVQELTSQLEALRRIDQEIKEKAPPTRPSEKMTPTSESAKDGEKEKRLEKEGKKDGKPDNE
jgi:hypothetical protein